MLGTCCAVQNKHFELSEQQSTFYCRKFNLQGEVRCLLIPWASKSSMTVFLYPGRPASHELVFPAAGLNTVLESLQSCGIW